MQEVKKIRVAWTYRDEYVCVEAFFKYIDYNMPLKFVRKEIMEYILNNVEDFNVRTKESWSFKIDNIHYLFRVWCGLPKAGLKGKTSLQVNIMDEFFKKSKFNGNTSSFSEEWYKSWRTKNYKLKKYNPKKDLKEITTIKMVRNKKIIDDYLKEVSHCESCLKNKTFIKFSDRKMYFEVHHFIPYNEKVQIDYDINLDNYYNLIALCPECHRAIHLSEDRDEIITKLFNEKIKSKEFKSFFGEGGIKKIIRNYETTYGIQKSNGDKIKDNVDELFEFV
ncbi:HNH endonuclease signature motif containing protein [Spiroplasma endosymbiont of Diplazon laetatorius]|uniref:HNH endonuclease signature motif containing protein n=1 Tax=Spiroplasma endosymbiont of Diplazon laetatorius TaxID=3066322 RepID=UPI0030D1AFE3